MTRSVWVSVLVLFGGGAVGPGATELWGASPEDQKYTIRLGRSAKVGDRFRIHVTETKSERTKTIVNDKVAKRETKKQIFELEATSTVVRVDSRKRPVHLRLDILQCVQRSDEADDEHVVLAKGAVVQAFVREGKTVFQVNGKQVSEGTSEVLDDLINLPTQPISDQDIFGTSEPKKVGDRWPIRADLMARSFAESDKDLEAPDPKLISGQMKLEKVEKEQGVPFITLTGKFTIKRFMPKNKGGATITRARLQAGVKRRYADDSRISRFDETLDMALEMELKIPAREKVPAITVQTSAAVRTERSSRRVP